MGVHEVLHNEDAPVVGEVMDLDMRRPMMDRANGEIETLNGSGVRAAMDLGKHGVHSIENLVFEVSKKAAHLKAYAVETVVDNPEVVKKALIGTVAVGVVAGAIMGLRHHKK